MTLGFEFPNDRDSNERLEIFSSAFEENPFKDIFNKYQYANTTSQEVLDEIDQMLSDFPALAALRETLDTTHPRYTGVYRYDPFSTTFLGQDGCFSSRHSMGPSVAYGRIFRELTSDKIHVLRTLDEVMVVIQHPSYFISPHKKPSIVNEPTVLFTTKAIKRAGLDDNEEAQVGIVIMHGERSSEVGPLHDSRIMRPEMSLAILRYGYDFYRDDYTVASEEEKTEIH